MLTELKQKVWEANLALVKYDLVTLTWGNVSGIDRKQNLMVIKPSGIAYENMTAEDMVTVDLNGRIVDGKWQPSSDTPTHLALYRKFSQIGGIAHTHSEYATAFAQACCEIPCLGTTHADHFHGSIPVTRFLSENEVAEGYELNTGKVIIERFTKLKPLEMPAVLVAGHAPFTWGKTPLEAVKNSFILEKVAQMALHTVLLNANVKELPGYVLQKHYARKHGPDAYYGQKNDEENQ
jgi:L-ribulose-5-phosphate 4-epimerase